MAVEDRLVDKFNLMDEGIFEPKDATYFETRKYTPSGKPEDIGLDRESVHNALMTAGLTPGIGNIADAADALMYAFEGEFGSAAISAAAMTPFIGQFVSAKKALKIAKKSGEEMVTVYRGIGDWYPKQMVKDGKFIGEGIYSQRMTRKGLVTPFYTTAKKVDAEMFAKMYSKDALEKGIKANPKILKFEVPRSWVDKNLVTPGGDLLSSIPRGYNLESFKPLHIFKEGIPKEFLTKVHNIDLPKEQSKGLMDYIKRIF